MSSRTGSSILEHTTEFFILSTLFDVASPQLLLASAADLSNIAVIVWSTLVFLWVVSAVWAYRHIKIGQVGEGHVLVRWGHAPRPRELIGHCLYAAVVTGNIFVLLVALLAPMSIVTQPSASLVERLLAIVQPIIHWTTITVAGMFTLMGAYAVRASYVNIRKSETRYSSPRTYDTLRAAMDGRLILGHEFAYVTNLPVTLATTTTAYVEPLEGEIVGRTVEKEIGQDGPFELDLGKERNPHVIITGTSGGGKSQAVRALILRHWLAKHIPSLVLDWTGEHRKFIQDMGGIVWQVPVNFKVNPLRLLGFSPAERAAELEESLTFTLGLSGLQAAEVGKVALEAYRHAGIFEEDQSTWHAKPPGWRDVIAILEARAQHGYYKGQQLESVNWSIRKLYRAIRVFGEEPTDFFDVVLKVPTCIDLSPLKGADIAKALVTYTIMQRIYHAFDARGFSKLRLLIVLDEAHLMLSKKAEEKGNLTQEPLPVRILRLGRKYGFALIFASQVPTIDISEPIVANAATVIALAHDAPAEVNFLRRWVNLSKSELEIYSRLPPGACFIKQLGNRYPSLVKIQMASDREIKIAKMNSIAQPIASFPERSGTREPLREQPVEQTKSGQVARTAEEKLLRMLDSPTSPSSVSKPPRSPLIHTINGMVKSQVSAETERGVELTLCENQMLTLLSRAATTMKTLRGRLPELTYRQILTVLHHLEALRLVQVARVPNLQGESTIYYGAFHGEWLQSESLMHRAMIDMIVETLAVLRPVPYMQTQRAGGDVPDIGLEATKPRTCVEVETHRKKMTRQEIIDWAGHVRERNWRLGYERIIVAVPNAAVEARYVEACTKHHLELATMSKLFSRLRVNSNSMLQDMVPR